MLIGYRCICGNCTHPLIDYTVVGQLIETVETIDVQVMSWGTSLLKEFTTTTPTRYEALRPALTSENKQFVYCNHCKCITTPAGGTKQTFLCMCGKYITNPVTGGYFNEVAQKYNIHFCEDCKHLIQGVEVYAKIAQQVYKATGVSSALSTLNH